MHHCRLLKPDEQARLEAFLLPRLETSMFLIANSREYSLAPGTKRLNGSYAALIDQKDQTIHAVAAHYQHGFLIIQLPTDLETKSVCQLALENSGQELKGIIGASEQVEKICSEMNLLPEQIRLNSDEILYQLPLEQLRQPTLPNVSGRPATTEDLAFVIDWFITYQIETGDIVSDSKEVRKSATERIENQIEEASIWLLLHENSPVAMAGYNAKIKEAVQIGGVYTPPQHRNQGFAKTVVATALQAALETGIKKGILFTHHENTPARKAYESLGFQAIGNYRICLLR